jgi:Protein of unknown function (DUF2585)
MDPTPWKRTSTMIDPLIPDPSQRSHRVRIGLTIAAIFGLATIALRLEGHRWWCRCGRLTPWSGDIHSEHNSQHLVDPYSFTHIEHGLLLYALLTPLGRWLGSSSRLILVVFLEAIWEVIENSPPVIERYRQATIALGYVGDSVVNSLGDISACMLGFVLASRLPVRWSIALVLTFEAALLAIYRDNLALNVLMLVIPLESVKTWQMGH